MQDRDQQGRRTPRWRGVTLLHELRSKGIPVAMASDNTRDQFFAYGDLDMLEVFNQVLNGQYWYRMDNTGIAGGLEHTHQSRESHGGLHC